MTRTFWLSFCDPDQPTGDQFLGVCVVQVTDEDAAAMREEIAGRFPHARPGAEWIGAASRQAHALGCNPGGEVLSADITEFWSSDDSIPLNRLMGRLELIERGLAGLPSARR